MLQQLERTQDLAQLSWPWSQAVEFADRSGTVSYSSFGLSRGSDESGTPVQSIQMSFLLDLSGGAISNGKLLVLDASQVRWNVNFGGALTGTHAVMSGIEGTLSTGAQVGGGSIGGVFVGNAAQPEFIGAFQLQSGVEAVQGLSVLKQ